MSFISNLTVITCVCLTLSVGEYGIQRESVLNKIHKTNVGSSIILNEKERIVNKALMKIKQEELKEGLKDPLNFPAKVHFFQAKEKIEQSRVYKFLKKLPKGATLHSHDVGLVSENFLFNLTYRSNLYGCFNNDSVFLLHFFNGTTTDECCWKPLCTYREEDPNFDDFLRAQLTIKVDKAYESYPTLEDYYKKLNNIYATVKGLLSYRPVLVDYLYEALHTAKQDNLIYLESRCTLLEAYDLNGNAYSKIDIANMYFDTLPRFFKDFPDFYNAKMIYYPIDIVDDKTMDENVNIYLELQRIRGELMAGFELSSLEINGGKISDYLPQLFLMKKCGVKFLYHAKHVNWYHKSLPESVVDALLLGVKRIDSVNVLVKYPELMKLALKNKVGIELTLIANQVEGLVNDFKNYAGVVAMNYLGEDSVIITSDDQTYWGAEGVSHDWYYVFMAMADECADLRFLKQMALNSLLHASFSYEERKAAVKVWLSQWNKFIDDNCEGIASI